MKKIKQKKCKVCETLFTPLNSLHTTCNYHCALLYSQEKSEKKKKKELSIRKKEWSIRKKELSIDAHSQKHKNTLQNEINKLSRMIDEHCGYINCIDCGVIMDKQIHGSHYHNVQGNENIRYNLLNIHSSRSECNQHHGGRKQGYEVGLKDRYSEDVLKEIEYLGLKYKRMSFSNKEIYEKISVVRKLQRNLKTFTSKDGYFLRNTFNLIIGLYK